MSIVVVTGANGLVGSQIAQELAARGAEVRAVVRRPGTAPQAPGISEHVGEFYDPSFAADVTQGATAVVNTVYPMAADDEASDSVQWAPVLANAARDAGAEIFVHVSSTSVYHRVAETGDVDENSALAPDDSDTYSRSKRDADLAVMDVEGITRVIARPTAIFGNWPTSVWNTLRPTAVRDEPESRADNPERSFGYVHIRDLARFIADVALGAIATHEDPEQGPVPGQATAVNLVTDTVKLGDYLGPVCEALGVEPEWTDRPGFQARLLNHRAKAWGWQPQVELQEAMAELLDGLPQRLDSYR